MPGTEVRSDPARAQLDMMPTLFGQGYGAYQVRRENFLLSFILHIIGAALLLYSAHFAVKHSEEIKQIVVNGAMDISPYVLPPAKSQAGGGGGGGDRDKLAASKGALPKLSDQ